MSHRLWQKCWKPTFYFSHDVFPRPQIPNTRMAPSRRSPKNSVVSNASLYAKYWRYFFVFYFMFMSLILVTSVNDLWTGCTALINGLMLEEPHLLDLAPLAIVDADVCRCLRGVCNCFFPYGGKDHDNRYTSDSGSNRFSCIIEARYYGDGRRIMGKSGFFRRAVVSATIGTGTSGSY